MRIEELKGEGEMEVWDAGGSVREGEGVRSDAKKRAVVGVGARVLFYPTLLYNVLRNKIQSEFHWWDEVDKFLLLGAVPFPADVPRLKQLGVCGVITMNEPYETLVPTSLYLAHGIENLVLPTRDYLFAPSFGDICKAVDFIHGECFCVVVLKAIKITYFQDKAIVKCFFTRHSKHDNLFLFMTLKSSVKLENASCGKTTYVHCKAGRGRSTTIVLCYLAVQEYYRLRVMKTGVSSCLDNPVVKMPAFVTSRKLMSFDDSSFVLISDSDLDGYTEDKSLGVRSSIWAEVGLVYRVQFAGRAALGRFSCLWVRCHTRIETATPNNLGKETCSLEAEQLGGGHPCLLRGVVVKL
ncbi:hypothetical protein Taro_040354 [Colocasia esculenta]|uniref:Tyrosine specific protein phosphatases domain-containing protein n=1 Tax=Colocasia esculenta TaxID=4460 RepID=A0A843W8S1_COLES|nr:hypothetical protein [Colocasia esculenta]